MDLNTQKEMFSYAYIEAVASVAGYSVFRKDRPMDNAGIDLSIEDPEPVEEVIFPRIDAQVKCTASETIIKENCIKFPHLLTPTNLKEMMEKAARRENL